MGSVVPRLGLRRGTHFASVVVDGEVATCLELAETPRLVALADYCEQLGIGAALAEEGLFIQSLLERAISVWPRS